MKVPLLDLKLQYEKIEKEVEEAVKEVLSLPIYPELAEDKVELVAREINNFFTAHSSRLTSHGI